jgi:hypothetical protein
MASNNWTNPVIGGTHVDILGELKGRDVDALKMIDDETPTNLPEKAKKWDDSLKVFRTYLSAVWTTLVLAIAGGGTGSNTAAGARTNLAVDSSTEVSGKVSTHNAITNPHSSTASPNVDRLVLRDAAGRAQVVAPSAVGDIAIKSTVDTVQTNLDTHAALANPHGAVSAPTVSKIILRDASGRAQVEDPSADKDLVNKQYLVASLPTTRVFSWVMANPVAGGIPGPRLKVAATVTRIDSYCIGATSVTFNIEERSTIGSAGSNLLAADQVADVNGETAVAFADSALAADNWLWLDIASVSGTPTMVVVTLSVTIP